MSYQQGYPPPSGSYGPPAQQYFGPASDEAPRRQKRRGVPTWLAFLFAFVTGIVGFVAGVAAGGSTTSTATAQQPAAKPATSKAAAAAPAKPRAAIPDDGTYLVPGEVKAGTYKAPGSERCYWARLKNTDGGVDSIIANSIQPGPQVVTIKATDKAFQTTGCGTWTKVA